MSTFNVVPNPPFLAVVLGVPAVTIMATAVLLTTDRSPAPVSYQASPRADGCVMFCEDVPKASFRDANCADAPPLINFRPWKCDPIDTPKPKGGR
ncbi:hypothetical protein [Nocardia suismassiliense]|uniref:hypothetical protein n=1 Tax=Nocardia suismassiliense TaxID=2077092 RepID=UPI000D1FBE3E|nr:hypothetical protein [Nocardia suismassiliense]